MSTLLTATLLAVLPAQFSGDAPAPVQPQAVPVVEQQAAPAPQPALAAPQAAPAPKVVLPERLTGQALRSEIIATLKKYKLKDASSELLVDAARSYLRLHSDLLVDTELAEGKRKSCLNIVRKQLTQINGQLKFKQKAGEKIFEAVTQEQRQRDAFHLAEAEKAQQAIQGKQEGKEMPLEQGQSVKLPVLAEVPVIEKPKAKETIAAQGAFGANPVGDVFGAGGTGNDGDYGDEFVELIQKVINPEIWVINGGPGTIYYWRQGRSIVVRAPQGVHDNVGNMLDQMGKMGQ